MLEASETEGMASTGAVEISFQTAFPPLGWCDADWQSFRSEWDTLPLDPYMADGGKYRRRRYAEFVVTPHQQDLLPHRPYTQTRDTNPLNGGIERYFEPLNPGTYLSAYFSEPLRWTVEALQLLTGRHRWFAQIFQNRISCHSDTPGEATPEGVHRDGVDYVLTMMIGRQDVIGGVSTIYDAATQLPALSKELDEPGSAILNDDQRTLHGVSSIVPRPGATSGHRDVLIAVLTHMDGLSLPVTG